MNALMNTLKNVAFTTLCIIMLCGALSALAGREHVTSSGTGRTITVGQDGGSDFTTIQAAINAAVDGDELVVAPGTYEESVNFKGKNITLRSNEPTSTALVAITIIGHREGHPGSVVSFNGDETSTCVLSGFTILGGLGMEMYTGPYFHGWRDGCGIDGNGTRATIQYNIVRDNLNDSWYEYSGYGGGIKDCQGIIQNNILMDNKAFLGGGIYNCNGIIRNNVIFNNSSHLAGSPAYLIYGGGIYQCGGIISNCIIWNNRGGQIIGSSMPTYSCIQDWTNGGEGNISSDPKFTDPDNYDFSLQPGSFCIDAGQYFEDMPLSFGGEQRGYNGSYAERGDGSDYDIGAFEYGGCITLGPPDNFWAAQGAAEDFVAIAWDEVVGASVYEVFRTTGTIFSDEIFQAEITGTYFEDQSAENIRYYYWVRVKDDCLGAIAGPELGYRRVPGRIIGKVVSNKTRLPIEGVDVYAHINNETYSDYYAITNQLGELFISNVPEESYHLILEQDGIPSKRFPGATSFNVGYAEAVDLGTISFDSLVVPIDYATIQEAIDVAIDGDEIIVLPGDFQENLKFGGKNIVLRSVEPRNRDIVAQTILRGAGSAVISFDGEEQEDCIVSGFTVTGGSGHYGSYSGGMSSCAYTYFGGAIYGSSNLIGAKATIRNNIIHDNEPDRQSDTLCYVTGYGGAIHNCDGIIENNIIYNNKAGYGGGLFWCDGIIQNNLIYGNNSRNGGVLYGCNGNIRNNTIYGNHGSGVYGCHGAVTNCVIWGNDSDQVYSSSNPDYSCIQDWTGGGEGNISSDPRFTDAISGDFHLRPDSPCIDAGKLVGGLAFDFEGELRPYDSTSETRGDGSDYDMGADEFIGRAMELEELHEGFIKQLYRDILRREADYGGWQHYVNQLLLGQAVVEQVTLGFLDSAEYAMYDRFLARCYFGLFNDNLIMAYDDPAYRLPDFGGMTYWQNAMNEIIALGGDLYDAKLYVVYGFLNSDEWGGRDLDLSGAEFVEWLYHHILGREPDAAGLSNHRKALKNGSLSREELILYFLESPEARARYQPHVDVAAAYLSLLQRTPDRKGFVYHLNKLTQQPGAVIELLHSFLFSPEYGARLTALGLYLPGG